MIIDGEYTMKKLFYGVRACVRMYIIGSTWFPQINVLFIKCKRLLVVSRGLIQSPLYSCYFFLPSACICGPLQNQRYFLIVYPLFFRGFILCLLAGLYCCSFVLCISFMLLQAHAQTHTHTLTYYIHKIFFSLTSFSWFSLRPCWIQPQAHSHIQCTISITKVFDVLVHHLRSYNTRAYKTVILCIVSVA